MVTLLVIVVMYLLCNVPRLTLNTAEYILRDKVHSVDKCDCFMVSLQTHHQRCDTCSSHQWNRVIAQYRGWTVTFSICTMYTVFLDKEIQFQLMTNISL